MKNVASKGFEIVLAVAWQVAARAIILSGNLKLFRDIFDYTQKSHRYYYDQLIFDDKGECVVHKHPKREFIWRAIAVTYVRYVCLKFPLVQEVLASTRNNIKV